MDSHFRGNDRRGGCGMTKMSVGMTEGGNKFVLKYCK